MKGRSHPKTFAFNFLILTAVLGLIVGPIAAIAGLFWALWSFPVLLLVIAAIYAYLHVYATGHWQIWWDSWRK